MGVRRFRIWVLGRLDESFGEGLVGVEQEDLPAATMLSGTVVDQSQLHGTLDLLRDLGIDVLRFEVDPPRGPGSAGVASGGPAVTRRNG
jgi:hypothetical protein